ncbi:MAG: 50S ribosomal protein L23 [Legionellales bacterium RIFCSPHIGHO2_12_FULL_42_9]|nr:MAG: 50S ribosomal protein L23 [Legionellales bacterium RIFCSPHIGHO2_12_FULL_42_9]
MNPERLLMIINNPHVSEKSTIIAEKLKQFTFAVLKTATKKEIWQAVEQLFDVKVKSVTVINVMGKSKRFRQTIGKRKDWKKAYVALHDGYNINFTTNEY